MNIYDIAKKANVSVATVSRVINRNGPVKESTRKKVEKAIAESHYTPSAIARSLSSRQTDNIGVIMPDIFNPFYNHVLNGITRVAKNYGYNTILFSAEESVERLHQILEGLKGQSLKGLILNPVRDQDDETVHLMRELESMGVPIVLFDRNITGINCNGVFSDDFGGAYSAVEHLIRIGHRRIAIFRGPQDIRPGRERFLGYAKALQDNGIQMEEKLVCDYDFLLNGKVYEQTRKLMKSKNPPTVFFTSNNFGTLECIKSLLDMGLSIGKDVGLIGFDEILTLQYVNQAISVVDREVVRMGMETMSLLQSCFVKEADKELKQKIVIDMHLLLRGSEYCEKVTGADGSNRK